jgi:H+/Cl- antiporter ClcA
MGLIGMFFSVVAIAAGAVMYWGVTATQGHGFRLSTVGVILMVLGGVGLVASMIVFAASRSSGRRTYDRQATDSQGRSAAVHEEVH